MSDFTSNFWPIFITAATLLGIAACLVLLYVTSKTSAHASDTDDGSTGHVWDGDLREMNNPLPLWWVGMFVISILFSLAYLVLYPGLGRYAGSLGWTQAGQYTAEVQAIDTATAPVYAAFAAMPFAALSRDPQAQAIGERLYMNNCAQCHASDARGSKGFPNLTDSDWLHGGSPEKIIETITLGRIGQMPPMAAAVGTPQDVKNVANYVMSLSGSPHDSLSAGLGKAQFTVCAACHGADGKGNMALGAPNLTDGIWLHGYGVNAITEVVNQGKVNQMPAQGGRLTEAQIRVLASYVWAFSNHPDPAAPAQ
jgi:cytochrome c oxidase cbb3-type subunit 3